MDIDSEPLTILETEPDARVELPSAEFQKICKNLAQFGDAVQVSVTEKSVSFSVNGPIGNGTITSFQFAATTEIKISCRKKIEILLLLRYLCIFAKAAPLTDTVIVEITRDHPLVGLFMFPDQAGFLKYYLAPVVELDDSNG
jgi:proliferating cell nuclear antigen